MNNDTNKAHELVSALEHVAEIASRLDSPAAALFLDFDGTLAPIVDHPEQARLPESLRPVLRSLSDGCPVAVISGRDLRDVRSRVALDELFYAGSHGLDIAGPNGLRFEHEEAVSYLDDLDSAARELEGRVGDIPGFLLERKRFSLAAHFRLVEPESVGAVRNAVDDILRQGRLAMTPGKKVFDFSPPVDWDKGRAVSWLLETLRLGDAAVPIYVGDDLTDEDALRAVSERGIGIMVGTPSWPTCAHYRLRDASEVERLLRELERRRSA